MKTHRVTVGLVSLCLLLLSTAAQADLLIEETFTGYQDDTLLSAFPAGPAEGLTGDWTVTPNSLFFVRSGKAVYDQVSNDNGTRHATRSTSAEHVLYENDGDVFYASFLIDPARANGHMTFELTLKQLDDGGTTDFAFGISGGLYIVGTGNSSVVAGDGDVTTGEQLVLVRIEYGQAIAGPDAEEVITLWVDPTDELSTPVIDGVREDFLNTDGGKITAVSMRGALMAGQPAYFDDLRVGTSFASVVPEPSTLVLVLVMGFVALIPVIRRRR